MSKVLEKKDMSEFFKRYFISLTGGAELSRSTVSNYTLGHDFETKLAKLLNENGLVANIITCKSGDYGIDIIATFNQQIILIQVKNIENSIGAPELQKIESSFKRFGEQIMGIIVYNSEKLKNPLTRNANIWWKSCCPEIKIMNEKEIVNFLNIVKKKEKWVMLEYFNPQANKLIIGNIRMGGFKAEKCVNKYHSHSVKKKPKIIVLTGAIGAGKTTFAKMLCEYLKQRGLKVFLMTEMALLYEKELEIFYLTRNELFIQKVILDAYRNFQYRNENYDVVILDRTHIDTEVFTYNLIKDEKVKEYLTGKCDSIDSKEILSGMVIYVRSEPEVMIKRQKERNPSRPWENCEETFLIRLDEEYERMIDRMYPSNVRFNTSEDLCASCLNLNRFSGCYKFEETGQACNLAKYMLFFSKIYQNYQFEKEFGKDASKLNFASKSSEKGKSHEEIQSVQVRQQIQILGLSQNVL
ncbi:P-loop containing nucleoside triphosphate hydrolase protein [Gigaspora rosea]|uniref:P-loop containing nucleoside triphosphate hydrolase protein n=1 Tax=Gigaspora rosea TaxID=44941 RepID=A0A397VMT4_9GLOM|nr:P-loop containing nucleoside triphosphate hydrolase protein [Gigaspora rosea]